MTDRASSGSQATMRRHAAVQVQDRAPDYAPIEDHGAIGNLRTVALVSRYGAIDWCCLPELDAGSVFGAILDHRRGGRFAVGPAGGARRGEQRYIDGTNVLETWWDTDAARVTVTDFMPLHGPIVGVCDPPSAPCIHRLLRGEGGASDIEIVWAPRFDYARAPVSIARGDAGFIADGAGARLTLAAGAAQDAWRRFVASAEIVDDGAGPALRGRLRLDDGERLGLLTWYGAQPPHAADADQERALHETIAAWRDWAAAREQPERADFAGEWQPLLERAALALKLLTYPRTGAIAAAATTSLPEEIGGVRNWDYRYTWIRDASFTAQALVALGHRTEAIDFLEWAERFSMRGDSGGELRLMYTLRGERDIPERELPHLEGYRGSRPVRIGNKAAQQFQLDIYGELLEAAYELPRLGAGIDEDMGAFLAGVADQACARWTEPDYGIWEVRSEPRHFVHSKLMVWVALDSALRLAQDGWLRGDVARWRHTRAAVRRAILEEGWNAERGAFVQYFGGRALDAANLLMPMVGFLPADDERVQRTLERSLAELVDNRCVYRYRTDETDDGLPGGEGAFGLATFWLVDALALAGRIDEAHSVFEGGARRANHVGLFAEQFDPDTGAFLGNFPQAFTHIGLINSAVYIAHAEGRELPAPPPIGVAGERDSDSSR